MCKKEVVIKDFADLVLFFHEISENGIDFLLQRSITFHCFYCGSTNTTHDLDVEAGCENAEILIACHDCKKFKMFIFDIEKGTREV